MRIKAALRSTDLYLFAGFLLVSFAAFGQNSAPQSAPASQGTPTARDPLKPTTASSPAPVNASQSTLPAGSVPQAPASGLEVAYDHAPPQGDHATQPKPGDPGQLPSEDRDNLHQAAAGIGLILLGMLLGRMRRKRGGRLKP